MKAKAQLKQIQDYLQAGNAIQVCTHTRATQFDKPKHAELFRVNSRGRLEAKYGSQWLDIGFTPIRFGYYKKQEAHGIGGGDAKTRSK